MRSFSQKFTKKVFMPIKAIRSGFVSLFATKAQFKVQSKVRF